MKLKEAVLGVSLLLGGCETNPCIRSAKYVKDGIHAAEKGKCDTAIDKYQRVRDANLDCMNLAGGEYSVSLAIDHLRNLIHEKCEAKK